MDVTCNRCGTIYEFEEGLISTTGTTVKCTQCGHLFKVHRPSVPPPPPGADGSKDDQLKWRVRRMDGSTHTLDSLAELTRLISAGQFHSGDEISRTGQIWKKLGEIAELTPLFDAPPRPRRMSDPPPVPRLELARSRAARTPSGRDRAEGDRSRRPSPPEQRFEALGSDIDLEERRTQPMTPLSDTAAAEAAAGTRAPTSPTPAQVDERDRRGPSEAGPAPQTEVTAAPDPTTPRVRALPLPLLMGLPLAIAGVVAGALLLRPPRLPAPEPGSRAFLIRGDQALAADRIAGFETAISDYQKALPFFKDDPHILSSISRAYAVWSQALRSRARAEGAAGGGTRDAGSMQEPEARRLADQAKLYGERAAQRNPGNEEASVAFSDALRLTGNLVAARAELDRARATEGVPAAETLRVAALLAIDETDGQANAGRSLAERAVEQDPTLIRARRLLVRCLIADGDLDAARLQLEALRKIDPEHPVLKEIAADLQQASAIAPKQKRASPRPESATAPSPAAAPAPAEAVEQAEERAATDPKELIRRGEAALERGAAQTAERAFQKALELEPGSPRAKTGLGYVALERSEPQLAINYFRAAAKDGRAEALIGLGDAYRRLGQIRDALGAYQTYLHRYPNGTRSSIARRQTELLSEQLGEGSTGGGNRVREAP